MGIEGMVFVNVYELFQEYGGSEEGGWWYTYGEFIASIITTPQEAEAVREELKRRFPFASLGKSYCHVNYRGGDYEVKVEDHLGESYPKTRPHYE